MSLDYRSIYPCTRRKQYSPANNGRPRPLPHSHLAHLFPFLYFKQTVCLLKFRQSFNWDFAYCVSVGMREGTLESCRDPFLQASKPLKKNPSPSRPWMNTQKMRKMIWRVEFSGCASRREVSLMSYRIGSAKAGQFTFLTSAPSPEISAAPADSSTPSRFLISPHFLSCFYLFFNSRGCVWFDRLSRTLDISERWLLLGFW